jgi:uncharacterized protein
MKYSIFLIALLIFSYTSIAQTVPYNAVFDLTSKDTNDHKTVIRWLNGITQENSDAKLEVVLYGQSIDMVRTNRSVVADAVKEFASRNNISFVVCAASMKRHNVSEKDLLPGVTTVPDGIYQIITRQKEGWGYIKVSH